MPFRFVHTADIHLDSPLRSLALRDPAIAALIGDATRAAFSGVVDLCLEERVDALLIAGDLYDGGQTSMKTARFLARALSRLDAAGIRTFVIRGNHDALSKITRELVLPPSVTIFDGRGGVREIEAGGLAIAVHGVSFSQPHAPESLLPKFRPPVPGAVNIGMLHTSLAGAPGHDVYAPCAIADLDAMGFEYWALGHIHARAEWRGRATIVMPGMPQGRDIGESGAKSVSLVTVGDDRSITIEARETAIARFERVPVRVPEDASWEALVAAQARALGAARAEHDTRHLVVRPILALPPARASSLAARALRDRDLLVEEARLAAERLDGVFIDKVEIEAAASARAIPDDGALGELAALVEGDVLSSAGLRSESEALVAEIVKALPRELRDLLGDSEEAAEAARAALMAQGAALVLARLSASGREER